MRKILLFCALIVITMNCAFTQTIRYVKPSATGTGDGSSWANASGNIQSMINASNYGNQVWIAAGTYLNVSLTMINGVSIYGGFIGNENSINDRQRSDLNGNGTIEMWEFTYATILDGQNARQILNQTNAFTIETLYDGLTIIRGTTNSATIRANAKLQNSICTIGTNVASIRNYGGIINNCVTNSGISNSNNGTVSNCVVNNSGITNDRGTISNCRVTGGGIYNDNGTVNNCIVTGNNGTGIHNLGANAIVSGCTVS
jgi:hypothetical protein